MRPPRAEPIEGVSRKRFCNSSESNKYEAQKKKKKRHQRFIYKNAVVGVSEDIQKSYQKLILYFSSLLKTKFSDPSAFLYVFSPSFRHFLHGL